MPVTDLHRPYIDELTRPNPDDPTGKSTMRRIEDVLDVWFDSGSMPYAQVHYPFENTEWFWRGLTGGRSVHLSDWPLATDLREDDGLVAAMDRVREVCSAASSLRKARGLRVRLPLSKLSVIAEDVEALQPFVELIKDELNVRDLELAGLEAVQPEYGVTQVLQVNARAAGPRLGKDVQAAINASKVGDWLVADEGTVTAGGIALQVGEYALRTVLIPWARRLLRCFPVAGS